MNVGLLKRGVWSPRPHSLNEGTSVSRPLPRRTGSKPCGGHFSQQFLTFCINKQPGFARTSLLHRPKADYNTSWMTIFASLTQSRCQTDAKEASSEQGAAQRPAPHACATFAPRKTTKSVRGEFLQHLLTFCVPRLPDFAKTALHRWTKAD